MCVTCMQPGTIFRNGILALPDDGGLLIKATGCLFENLTIRGTGITRSEGKDRWEAKKRKPG